MREKDQLKVCALYFFRANSGDNAFFHVFILLLISLIPREKYPWHVLMKEKLFLTIYDYYKQNCKFIIDLINSNP